MRTLKQAIKIRYPHGDRGLQYNSGGIIGDPLVPWWLVLEPDS